MHNKVNHVYLSLGSNIGNRASFLNQAVRLLSQNCGTLMAQSAIYETAPWGLLAQDDFLNMAVALDTALLPNELLAAVLQIETSLGRVRTEQWGPRTIDIDILLYGTVVVADKSLTVPHPLMHERRFTLQPLADIAPNVLHPLFKKTVTELLLLCPDTAAVSKVTA
jgi:2-amino-4-hydroxy-6-hydroxymethyldihydropteridine diphosphokinase